MGLPLAPIVADLWMEYFEKKALTSTPDKPRVWYRYVDDTFCILKQNKAEDFLKHLNSLHIKTKFTMEEEKDGIISSLDVRIIRNDDGTLAHAVHRKITHTNRYLHASSHHHPANLRSVVSTLVHRAHRICDDQHLDAELQYVDDVLKCNGYSKKQRSWKPISLQRSENSVKPSRRAFLPYVKGVTDRVGKILKRYEVKSIFLPPKKVKNYLQSPKDRFPLQTSGVYTVPCSCGSSYIGQTKRSVATRLKEHINAISKNQREKSAICEHILDHPSEHHWIHFEKAEIIASEPHYIPRLVREAIEIKRRKNFNRDNSFPLSRTWDPVLHQRSIRNNLTTPSDVVSVFCLPSAQNQQQQPSHTQQTTHRYNLRSSGRP